jgi:hypothetical protein
VLGGVVFAGGVVVPAFGSTLPMLAGLVAPMVAGAVPLMAAGAVVLAALDAIVVGAVVGLAAAGALVPVPLRAAVFVEAAVIAGVSLAVLVLAFEAIGSSPAQALSSVLTATASTLAERFELLIQGALVDIPLFLLVGFAFLRAQNAYKNRNVQFRLKVRVWGEKTLVSWAREQRLTPQLH